MHMEDKGDIYSNVKKRVFQMEADYKAIFSDRFRTKRQ